MIGLQEGLRQLRAEYLEMPGLRLNAAQVQRLCGMERMICQTALDGLVEERFLGVSPEGYYARSTDGEIPRPRDREGTTRHRNAFREGIVTVAIPQGPAGP